MRMVECSPHHAEFAPHGPIGSVALPRGVALDGHVMRTDMSPALGVNIDVVDEATGEEVDLQGDNTDAFGNFTVAVPRALIEVQLKTNNTAPLLAPIAMQMDPKTDTDLGDLTLVAGFNVSGTVVNGSSVPIQGADIDVETTAGEKLFTPSDSTNSSGVYSVVVPAGTLNFEVCPKPTDLLVAEAMLGQSISADTNLGTTSL